MDYINVPIKTPSIIGVFADCGGGKSHLIKCILYNLARSDKFDHAIVFSPTAFRHGFNYLPKKYVFEQYDSEVLKKYAQIQRANRSSRGLVVFDDCLGVNHFRSRLFTHLITTYRHYNLSFIISSQYLQMIPLMIRSLISYVAIFKLYNSRSFQAAYDTYGKWFDNIKQFKQFLNEHTQEKYRFLWLDKEKDSQHFTDKYESLIAPPPDQVPVFKISY